MAWIRKTIRKVMTVVAVLTTSCHESEYSNRDPVAPQRPMRARAMTNAAGLLTVNALVPEMVAPPTVCAAIRIGCVEVPARATVMAPLVV